MKLNWAERWVVNNPSRVIQQRGEIWLLKRMQALPPEAAVLEIGCGRGAGAGLILKQFQPGVLHAMDLDVDMIRRAQKYLRPEQQERICLYTADVMQLPYRDQALDAVFGFGVLHHVPDWQSAVAEIARILKVGGVYFIEELYPYVYQNFITKHILLHPTENRFFSRDLKEVLTACNLKAQHTLEVRLMGILGAFVKMG